MEVMMSIETYHLHKLREEFLREVCVTHAHTGTPCCELESGPRSVLRWWWPVALVGVGVGVGVGCGRAGPHLCC